MFKNKKYLGSNMAPFWEPVYQERFWVEEEK